MSIFIKKFETIDYLSNGTAVQRRAWEVLAGGGIFESLAAYCPVLAGTVPIGIDIASSDLDIVCRADDREAFRRDIVAAFGDREGFRIWENENKNAMICSFTEDGMPIEVFGSEGDPLKSNAYRHMIVEARLLDVGGDRLKKAVTALKKAGIKTEPAFASLLGLEGDPFIKLLELEELGDDDLANLLDGVPNA